MFVHYSSKIVEELINHWTVEGNGPTKRCGLWTSYG